MLSKKYRLSYLPLFYEDLDEKTALAALKKLTEEGLIIRKGAGRSTFYIRADSK